MKSLIYAVVAASVIAAPAISFAQSNVPVTRAQVRAELIQLEQAGYRIPVGNDPYYPADLQAAEARVAAQNANRQADAGGYGAPREGSSESARPASMDDTKSIFFGR